MIDHLRKFLPSLVYNANRAPSVHNTQPAKWHLDDDSNLFLILDEERLLPVGDPTRCDALLSCGAALEGFHLACREHGMKVSGVDHLSERGRQNKTILARLDIREDADLDPLSAHIGNRFTWRGGFVDSSIAQNSFLNDQFSWKDDITLIVKPKDIKSIAEMNDEASLHFLSDRDYRRELHDWMRFSKSDANWSTDGLNSIALGLGNLEAKAADIVLGGSLFDILNKLQLGKVLVSEKSKTCTSTAIMLFHRPVEEHPLESGRAFYRAALELAAHGMSTWPMAVLADGVEWRNELISRYQISYDRRLINVLRIGVAPENANPGKARLATETLII